LASEVSQTTQLNQELALVLAEKNKLLTSLSSSMKSTRMGAMASTLAHEINQPLSAIRLNAEMAQREVSMAQDLTLVQNNLQYLIEDVDRIDSIVNKIKKFFYNDYSDFKNLQLAALVNSTFDYVQEGCNKSNIDLLVNIDPKLHIYGDKGQLQMVVFNLMSNAMDALEDKEGTRFITINAEPVGDHIDLIVQDNGAGVAPEVMGQIFDLFRTTKPDGMGVGLWLSRAVMENHRGHLTYSTAAEGGARFVMQFPQPLSAPSSAS
jgi:signal transduction histidine kinase